MPANPMPDPNAVRYRAGSDHVESWFWRANHPDRRSAIWLKATLLGRRSGTAIADAWCAVFDEGWTWAGKVGVDVADSQLGRTLNIAGCSFDLDGHSTRGTIHDASWELDYEPLEPLGRLLVPYSDERMVTGRFPRSKLLTPVPVARFSGRLSVAGRTLDIDDWLGMQGHNWGASHAYEYAWGQCIFPAADGEPHCMVEGFSGRIELGPFVSPLFSALLVRRGDREYRFDRVFRRWRQRPRLGRDTWSLRIRGEAGDATLSMEADPGEMVCLGYANPGGHLSYCFNSKLARTTLTVNPRNDDGFTVTSEHGGALEFLRRAPDPRFPDPT